MKETRCVICDRRLGTSHHVDTCSERCYRALLKRQRAVNRRLEEGWEVLLAPYR